MSRRRHSGRRAGRAVRAAAGGWRCGWRAGTPGAAKARSALVVAMIGIPVLLVAALSLLLRTVEGGDGTAALRDMGPTDALVTTTQSTQVRQDFSGERSLGIDAALADPADRHMTPSGSPR